MEGLGLAIPEYDPKKYLSQVSIFEKRKLEDQTIESKYGVTFANDGQIDTKRVKLECNEEEQADVKTKLESTCNV